LLEGRVAWELRIPNDRSWNGKKVLKLGSDLGLHMWSTGRGEEKNICVWWNHWHSLGPLAKETWKEDF